MSVFNNPAQLQSNSGAFVNQGDLQAESLSQYGCQVVTDTATYTATAGKCYFALQVLAQAIIDTYSTDATALVRPNGGLSGITLPAGSIIYGKFLTVKLTSGTVIAHNGVL